MPYAEFTHLTGLMTIWLSKINKESSNSKNYFAERVFQGFENYSQWNSSYFVIKHSTKFGTPFWKFPSKKFTMFSFTVCLQKLMFRNEIQHPVATIQSFYDSSSSIPDCFELSLKTVELLGWPNQYLSGVLLRIR